MEHEWALTSTGMSRRPKRKIYHQHTSPIKHVYTMHCSAGSYASSSSTYPWPTLLRLLYAPDRRRRCRPELYSVDRYERTLTNLARPPLFSWVFHLFASCIPGDMAIPVPTLVEAREPTAGRAAAAIMGARKAAEERDAEAG